MISWRRTDENQFPRKVDANKSSGVLEIPYFQQEDAGQYECVAENSRGKNAVKGHLSFFGKSEKFPNILFPNNSVDLNLNVFYFILCLA